MKYSVLPILVFSACLYAQPPQQTAPLPSATPMAPASDSTVVATVGGKPLTAGDVRHMADSLPPQVQQQIMRNAKGTIQQLVILQHLSEEARKDNLSQMSPFRQEIEFQRLQLLAQAEVQHHNDMIVVPADEQQQRYAAEKDKFAQAKIRAIVITFTGSKAPSSGPSLKLPVTKEMAKSKADDLVKQLRGGADFATLAKANSDDHASAEKGGEFGYVHRGNDAGPVRQAIFSAKVGDITDPIEQGNAFYIIKVEDVGTQPFVEVQQQVISEIKHDRFEQWLGDLRKQYEVNIENDEFFEHPLADSAPPAAPAVKPSK
jgi:peptidyl-prolyl cis-trans isomerase C